MFTNHVNWDANSLPQSQVEKVNIENINYDNFSELSMKRSSSLTNTISKRRQNSDKIISKRIEGLSDILKSVSCPDSILINSSENFSTMKRSSSLPGAFSKKRQTGDKIVSKHIEGLSDVLEDISRSDSLSSYDSLLIPENE